MSGRHRIRRTLLALVALAAVVCAASGVLIGTGVVKADAIRPSWWPAPAGGVLANTDPGTVVGPVDPAHAGSYDKAPPRKRSRLFPTQFAAITNAKSLIGTPWANIVVFPDSIRMQAGARVLFTATFKSVPGFDGSISLDDLTTLVSRSPAREWLTEPQPGIFQLKAGIVEAPGTVLTVAAPRVRELRMIANPYVYVSGVSATAQFRGVKVTSWLEKANGPDTDPNHARPFVVMDRPGSRLDITDSEMCYLGADTSRGYGVSWGQGTGGQALRSVFHDNLFGAYTGQSVGVTFQNNVFRDNARYGLDPHTDSHNLTIIGNEAYGNNTHGIIFSKGVVDSIIADNHSHDNGANGIMMDELSNNNVIRNNVTEHNAGTGITLQGSSGNQVSGNVVANNPIGIRVNANELGAAVGNKITGNQLSGNHTGIKVYNATRDTALQSNSIRDSVDSAMVLLDPATSQSDTVQNARKAAIVGRGTSTLRALSAQRVASGVVVGSGATATMEAANIQATDVGILMHDGTLNLGGPPSTVTGARKAVIVSGNANLTNVTFDNVTKGIVLDPSARVSLDSSQVLAKDVGLEVLGLNGADRITMHNSTVRAANPLAGVTLGQGFGNVVKQTLSWLAIAGAFFVALAVVLYLLHRVYSPRSSSRDPRRPARQPVTSGQRA